MQALGLSMIIGGMAFLISGLIFLLPRERNWSNRENLREQTQSEIQSCPDATRDHAGQ
jgi:hypothetical protein